MSENNTHNMNSRSRSRSRRIAASKFKRISGVSKQTLTGENKELETEFNREVEKIPQYCRNNIKRISSLILEKLGEIEENLTDSQENGKVLAINLKESEESKKAAIEQNKEFRGRICILEADYEEHIKSYNSTIEYQETRIAQLTQQNQKMETALKEDKTNLQQLEEENAGLRFLINTLQKALKNLKGDSKYYNLKGDCDKTLNIGDLTCDFINMIADTSVEGKADKEENDEQEYNKDNEVELNNESVNQNNELQDSSLETQPSISSDGNKESHRNEPEENKENSTLTPKKSSNKPTVITIEDEECTDTDNNNKTRVRNPLQLTPTTNEESTQSENNTVIDITNRENNKTLTQQTLTLTPEIQIYVPKELDVSKTNSKYINHNEAKASNDVHIVVRAAIFTLREELKEEINLNTNKIAKVEEKIKYLNISQNETSNPNKISESKSGKKDKQEHPKDVQKNRDGQEKVRQNGNHERSCLMKSMVSTTSKKKKLYLIGDSHIRYLKGEIQNDINMKDWQINDNFKSGYNFRQITTELLPEAQDTDIIIISAGTNDLYRTEWESIKQSIDILSSKKCKVVLILTPPQNTGTNADIIKLNTLIKHHIKSYNNIGIIDTHKFIQPWHSAVDGVHLGRKGKMYLAKKITEECKGNRGQSNNGELQKKNGYTTQDIRQQMIQNKNQNHEQYSRYKHWQEEIQETARKQLWSNNEDWMEFNDSRVKSNNTSFHQNYGQSRNKTHRQDWKRSLDSHVPWHKGTSTQQKEHAQPTYDKEQWPQLSETNKCKTCGTCVANVNRRGNF
uniref:Uncharacterized protein n=3 Tax=Cacopsylla melanoneura TaxID=428564 RepID=A0A8D9E5R3_9HEMI